MVDKVVDVGKYGRFTGPGGRKLKYYLPRFWRSPMEIKLKLREYCKKTQYYYIKIRPAVEVKVNGKVIKVDTLGRWAFGVPGYMAHCRFYEENGAVAIDIPGYIPELVKMFDSAIAQLREDVMTANTLMNAERPE